MAVETANKVKYGLSNVHYAVLQSDADGTATFAVPVAIPGAVSLNLDPQGDKTEFYADNMNYFSQYGNAGYSGTLEMARIPDSFRKDVLDETEDVAAGVLYESVNAHPKEFALLFEFDGDKNATRYAMYKCSVSRPSVSGNTTGAQKEPTTETLNITTSALSNGFDKAQTTKADGTAYSGWYTAVHQKAGK